MTNKIVLVTNDFGGREALYLNGSIVIQNNPMPRFEVTETLTNNQPFDFEDIEVCGEWLEKVGRYPESFEDIPVESFTS